MKKGKEKVFTVKASKMKADGQEIQDIEQLKEANNFTMTFETAKDYLIFSLSVLILKINGLPDGNSLKRGLGYLVEMRDFFDTRVTDFRISSSPGSPIPYKYDVAYKAIGEETKEQVEEKIKEYLHSDPFNLILSKADPRVLEIIKQKQELRKKDEEIAKLKAENKKKTGKLKTGKHFIDNALKNSFETQLPLFENLTDENKKKIQEAGTSLEMINSKGEGINLSKGEIKLILCLAKLLQDKSNNTATEKGDYYLGNDIEGIDNTVEISTQEGNKIALKTPTLSFSLHEITKEFTLENNPGGNDIKAVAKILYSLAYSSEKKALIRYHRKEFLGKNRERITKIETYSSLINIFNFEQEDLLNGKKIDQAKEVIVSLHPVFIDQIDKLFIELPMPKDIMTAYGGANVSEVVFKLIFELSRAHSNRKRLPKDEEGNPIYTIGVKKLYQKIAESYMRENRKSLTEKYFLKSVETAKALGLIKLYTQEAGASGDKLYKFTLAKDW